MKVTTVLGSGTADAAPERVQVGIVIRGEQVKCDVRLTYDRKAPAPS